MTAPAKRLLKQARAQYGEIFPCEGRKWEGCLTNERGKLMLWFDTPDHNTHMVYEHIKSKQGGQGNDHDDSKRKT